MVASERLGTWGSVGRRPDKLDNPSSKEAKTEVDMINKDEVLTAADMSETSGLFGIVIEQRKDMEPLLHLYSEDDENYFYRQTFSTFWCRDLAELMLRADKLFFDLEEFRKRIKGNV